MAAVLPSSAAVGCQQAVEFEGVEGGVGGRSGGPVQLGVFGGDGRVQAGGAGRWVDSELLQQLSGDRLGFADNFDIVSLTTHASRSSRTLSGGETFQASLALSLALMEMHGRSGTRLESLFLDEGFGTLDTAALDSALQVLRTHVRQRQTAGCHQPPAAGRRDHARRAVG
ncbi:SbcC/MukB-like Walker B domain-containing protein [Streptomyces sp. NPDC047046]|uniref:SbcC/MukB-like Walker B domain-containing protein n=1 Tax=Streptomyces sp. NPDC047046 TaxID=3155378 RepID=UPI0033D721A8